MNSPKKETFSKKAMKLSNIIDEINKTHAPEDPDYLTPVETKSNDERYITLNERYTVTKEKNSDLYDVFVSCAVKSNEIYNLANRVQRNRFLKSKDVNFYQDLKQYIFKTLEYLKHGCNSKNCTDITVQDEYLVERFFNMPESMRLGPIYDLSDAWFKFMRENSLYNYNIANNSAYNDELKKLARPKIPYTSYDPNKRRSFTINPDKIKIIANPQYVNKWARNGKKLSRKTIENYEYLLVIPMDLIDSQLSNKVNKKNLYIPTNQYKNGIIQVRVTPNRGRFNVDIRYRIQKISNMDYTSNLTYDVNRKRIAGIDLGLDNLVAIANNVGASPLLIKGKSLVAMNTYYNDRINKLKYDKSNKSHKDTKQIKILDNRRINKMHNYMDHVVIKVVKYLDIIQCKTLVIGINDSVYNAFRNKWHEMYMRQIDFKYLIDKIQKKCKRSNINVVLMDESYTSSTSILDNRLPIQDNTEKYRRFTKRLYMTQSVGVINSDVNSAMQIICKYEPNAFKRVLLRTKEDAIYGYQADEFALFYKNKDYQVATPATIYDFYVMDGDKRVPLNYPCGYTVNQKGQLMCKCLIQYGEVPIEGFTLSFLTRKQVYGGSSIMTRKQYCMRMIYNYHFHNRDGNGIAAPMLKGALGAGMLRPISIGTPFDKFDDSFYSRVVGQTSYMGTNNNHFAYKGADMLIAKANANNGTYFNSLDRYNPYR